MSTKAKYQKEIEEAIGKAQRSQIQATVEAIDGAEVYAYPRSEGRIAWGVNRAGDGFNVLRGIRRPDGTDEAEM